MLDFGCDAFCIMILHLHRCMTAWKIAIPRICVAVEATFQQTDQDYLQLCTMEGYDDG
jgi:hypothetical protein